MQYKKKEEKKQSFLMKKEIWTTDLTVFHRTLNARQEDQRPDDKSNLRSL